MKSCSRLIILLLVILATHPLQGRDVSLRVDNPADAVAAANKAIELEKKGDLEGAIGYYTAAFKIDPQMYVAIYCRGTIYMRQHKWEQALADFNQALTVSHSFLLAAIKRAEVYRDTGQYDKAIAQLNQIIALHPRLHTDALARSDRAWIYATCSNPAYRNGKQAVADADAACHIDAWDSWDYIDTLAAAYAEAGDFEKAIKFEEKAIHKASGDASAVKGAQERLALYQQHRPFHLAAAR